MIGNTPGDMVIVSDDDPRISRKCESPHLKSFRTGLHCIPGLINGVHPHLVPDRGHLNAEVRVIGQDSGSGGGQVTGNCPGVRADAGPAAREELPFDA